jgi:hypothetical protein
VGIFRIVGVTIIVIAHIKVFILITGRGRMLEEMIKRGFRFRVIKSTCVPKFAPFIPVLA